MVRRSYVLWLWMQWSSISGRTASEHQLHLTISWSSPRRARPPSMSAVRSDLTSCPAAAVRMPHSHSMSCSCMCSSPSGGGAVSRSIAAWMRARFLPFTLMSLCSWMRVCVAVVASAVRSAIVSTMLRCSRSPPSMTASSSAASPLAEAWSLSFWTASRWRRREASSPHSRWPRGFKLACRSFNCDWVSTVRQLSPSPPSTNSSGLSPSSSSPPNLK
mmetsp:Transcript_45204/g.75395  ORF Transcript_45204/g.75395 Transcript_45204/m.75395 type:complete len:217 (+) Transcript_45204:156-806(+)